MKMLITLAIVLLSASHLSAQRSAVSVGNTSTAPLGAGLSFVGTPERPEYNNVFVFALADQSGALSIQWSTDGSTFNSTLGGGPIPVSAGVPVFHQAVNGGRWVRISFQNTSSSPQASFTLHTAYGEFNQLTATLDGTISQHADAIVTRPTEFSLLTALGKVGGFSNEIKFGENDSIDTNTDPEDIWDGGGLYAGQPATCPAEKLEVFSSDAADTLVGTGARTVKLAFLDDSFSQVTETLSLNGLTGAQTTANGCRLTRIQVMTAGTGAENAGSLTVRNVTTTANVYEIIDPGANQSQLGAFTVPAGKNAVLRLLNISIGRSSGAAGSARFHLLVREEDSVYQVRRNFQLTTGAPMIIPIEGQVIPSKADVIPRIESVSDNSTSAAVVIQYFLVDVN